MPQQAFLARYSVRPYVITVFGAESTGKTTLSRQLTLALSAPWYEEYARPYLEKTGAAVTTQSMRAIWHGQRSLQTRAKEHHKPYSVQDTDLFSTVGYWQLPHRESSLGMCPTQLISDAQRLRSDLYLITQSNIPFEADPLRYGGDRRESLDDYWVHLCETYQLPYVVIKAHAPKKRLAESLLIIKERTTPCAALS
ncbi:MAG TPA: ATP-binding protein [Candidatus Saccharimonas sp.]|nr:ATP-binding protein [Candidatus Saccharimonas sp.]